MVSLKPEFTSWSADAHVFSSNLLLLSK